MYGGVSLAIYINGVAREFFDAVRGRRVYRLLKALTDSDIVVDVISGTSAGGINGIMLSYALCNNCEFSSAANLWREHGDLAKLLRPPHEQANALSLLNSEGYYQPKLEEVFRQMPRCDAAVPEDPSAMRELDLYVTSTNVNGRTYTLFDDAGHPIDVKDHRAVFHLSHRSGRREPFAAVPNGKDAESAVTFHALAKLSRATSCFPAAFAPVRVDIPLADNEHSPDGLLSRWGNLGVAADNKPGAPKAQTPPQPIWFLDGGVLDNKPFTYTIKAISSRNSDREVSRTLFYIEPDPECMKPVAESKTSDDEAVGPSIVQSILAALIGIPGYESIADDLKMIGTRNSKIAQYNRLLLDFPETTQKPSPEAWTLYTRCRLVALSERVVRGIFRVEGQESLIEDSELRKCAAALIKYFDEGELLRKSTPAKDGAPVGSFVANHSNILDQFDVYYHRRRTSRLIYLLHSLLYTSQEPPLPDAKREKFKRLLCALNLFVDAYDIIAAAMERLIDEANIPWQQPKQPDQVWQTVRGALQRLIQGEAVPGLPGLSPVAFAEALDRDPASLTPQVLTPQILTELSTALRGIGKTVVSEFRSGSFTPPTPAEDARGTFLASLDRFLHATIEHLTDAGDPVRRAEENFPTTDALIFPLELVGDLHEKDMIKTVRISPLDAKRGFSAKDDHTDKVAGDAMHHFGGFFKRSWRSNDILWGRLDGTCQIVETLLDHGRLDFLTKDAVRRAGIADAFFTSPIAGEPRTFREELDPKTLFPKAGAATHGTLRKWLADLLINDPPARDNALDETRFDGIRSLLVEAAQLEVIGEDFPTVLQDAIAEQAEWNSYRLSPPLSVGEKEICETTSAACPFNFKSPGEPFDPFFASVAALERTQLIMKVFENSQDSASRPTETLLGKYFQNGYKVGQEELTRDIPTPILLEILAHTLLVTRNCVLTLCGKSRKRVTSNWLYRFGFDIPLRSIYALIILSRRSRKTASLVFATLAGASIATLIISIFWFTMLGTFTPIPILLLWVLPLAVLFGGGWLMRKLALRS